jgi:hypothetical protein
MEHVKELIEALPGVEFVHVSVNRTWEDDKKTGLPPHSFKVYVLGGKKKDIAHIIWMNKPIGVWSLGNTGVKVRDSLGYKHLISFERLL